MSASQIHLVVGDTAPPLTATLTNARGPQDLTGATVVARLKRSTDGDVVEVTMDLAADPTTGVVTHDWDPSETDEVLRYTTEFVVTFANGTVETFPNESKDVPTISIRAKQTT
jgi:ketosteroid isomerase-like protein